MTQRNGRNDYIDDGGPSEGEQLDDLKAGAFLIGVAVAGVFGLGALALWIFLR